jgi:hypothetical protein
METTLIIHAIAAPIIFAGISLVYFGKFSFTTPLQTAIIFTASIIVMDFSVVAMLINRSFEMFVSLLGTWIPFALIFFSAFLTGLAVTSKPRAQPGKWKLPRSLCARRRLLNNY